MTDEAKAVQALREEIFSLFAPENCIAGEPGKPCDDEENTDVDCSAGICNIVNQIMEVINANYISIQQAALRQAQYDEKIKEGIKKAAEIIGNGYFLGEGTLNHFKQIIREAILGEKNS